MIKKAFYVPLITICFVVVEAQAARCGFQTPEVDVNVCSTLNMDRGIESNPYRLENENISVCGNTASMPSLPNLDEYGQYLEAPDLCDALPNVMQGNDLTAQLQNLLSF